MRASRSDSCIPAMVFCKLEAVIVPEKVTAKNTTTLATSSARAWTREDVFTHNRRLAAMRTARSVYQSACVPVQYSAVQCILTAYPLKTAGCPSTASCQQRCNFGTVRQ